MRAYTGYIYDPTPTVTILKQSDLLRCPFVIMVPEHYRADGTCKCDSASYRRMMMREWQYKPSDFPTPARRP